MKSEFFFTADVGNTRIKVAAWRVTSRSGKTTNERIGDVCSDASEAFEVTERWLDRLGAEFDAPCAWCASSVAPKRADALVNLLRRKRPNDSFFTLKHGDVPIATRYKYPDKLGIDRIVAAYAGVKVVGKGAPFLVIDVGTAATIDFIDGNGVFRGGAILSGSKLAAKALHDYTAALPMLDEPDKFNDEDSESALTFPATETSAAIRIGVFHSIIGAITVFYWQTRRIVESEGGDPKRLAMLIAGGDFDATERLLRQYFQDLNACLDSQIQTPDILAAPGLVLQGVADLAVEKISTNLK